MGHRRKTGQHGWSGPQAQKQLEWELRTERRRRQGSQGPRPGGIRRLWVVLGSLKPTSEATREVSVVPVGTRSPVLTMEGHRCFLR